MFQLVYVVMFTESKDKGDEVHGFFPLEEMASRYCETMNKENKGIYYYEECSLLMPV